MIRPLTLYAAFFLAGAAALPPGPQGTASSRQTPVPPGTQEDPARPPIAQYRSQRADEILAGLEGTWSLAQFLHNSTPVDPGLMRGYASFHEGYGCIVVHAIDEDTPIDPEPLFQASMFHYRLDQTMRLQTSTLIGHSNFSGEFFYEDDWTPREFNVDLLGDTLILTRPDGSRLQFLRMSSSAFPERTLNILREVRGESLPAKGGERDF